MKAAFSSALTRPRPSDTHFSKSSTPGGESPLARDDDNTLVTHAVLFDGTKTALVILGTGVALGAAATVKVAPHIKSGLTSLKSKLRRRAEDTTDAETPVPLTVVAEIEPEQQDPLDCALSDRQARRRRGFG